MMIHHSPVEVYQRADERQHDHSEQHKVVHRDELRVLCVALFFHGLASFGLSADYSRFLKRSGPSVTRETKISGTENNALTRIRLRNAIFTVYCTDEK